jgi:hypothetical protein
MTRKHKATPPLYPLEHRLRAFLRRSIFEVRLWLARGEWHHGGDLSIYTKTVGGRMYILKTREAANYRGGP